MMFVFQFRQFGIYIFSPNKYYTLTLYIKRLSVGLKLNVCVNSNYTSLSILFFIILFLVLLKQKRHVLKCHCFSCLSFSRVSPLISCQNKGDFRHQKMNTNSYTIGFYCKHKPYLLLIYFTLP